MNTLDLKLTPGNQKVLIQPSKREGLERNAISRQGPLNTGIRKEKNQIALDAIDTEENRSKIETALRSLSNLQPKLSSRYQMRIHSTSGKLQIHVVNGQTGEVIDEIPSNRLLEFYGMIEELNGFFLEKRV